MKEAPNSFHFLGICGTAMGAVAVALQERGFKVTGSDENVYPPMSNFLQEKGLTTQLLERGSKYADSLCDVCARACEELAEACDKHAEIEAFSRCGEACRKCAEECAELAKLKSLPKANASLSLSVADSSV